MEIRKYLIIDDNEAYVTGLSKMLHIYPLLELVGRNSSLEEGITVLASQPVDLIFLDFNLAKSPTFKLLQFGLNMPPIVLTSFSSKDLLESFGLGVTVSFLVKPFSTQQVFHTLDRIFNLQLTASSFANSNSIFLKAGRKIQRFNFADIQYIESYGIYSKVYVGVFGNIVNERLNTLAKLLPSQFFIRVHKSYIINIGKIASYDKANFSVDHAKIPIGISFRPKLEGLLNLLEVKADKQQDG